MRSVALLIALVIVANGVVPSAQALPRDVRLAKRAATLSVRDLSALKVYASRLEGREADRFRKMVARMGLPDQDRDGSIDVLEELDGTNACNPMSDGENRDGSLRKREGEVDDISDDSITVGDLEFVLRPTTEFSGIDEEELDIGVCVEVKGFEDIHGDVIATEVSASYSCDGSGWDSPFSRDSRRGGRGYR